MYKLEVISQEPKVRRFETPLLFVHGAYVAAWCWQEHFLPYFASLGYSCHAVSLRGHGKSDGGMSLHSFHLRDYAEDVATTVAGLDAPPVLIGHSMGGMVVQKYLESETVPAAVFLNTIPTVGVGMAAFEIALRAPFSYAQLCLVQNWGNSFATPNFSRDMLFSRETPNEILFRYQPMFQAESQAAIMDMSGVDMPHPDKVNKVPMLFIGSEGDRLFSRNMIRKTARRYGADAVFVQESGHMLMLDTRWQDAADLVDAWLSGSNEDESFSKSA